MKIKPIEKVLRSTVFPVIALAILAGSYFHILDSYEFQTLDFRFRLRPAIVTTDKVVIIEIGGDTIKKIGRFPFDRAYHAMLVNALSQAGARAIVFDLFFSEPHKDDAEFAAAMEKARNVYLPVVLEPDRATRSNIPRAAGMAAESMDVFTSVAKGGGHINVIPDADGKYRRAPLVMQYQGAFYPYLSLLVSCDYLGIPQKDIRIIPGKSLVLGSYGAIPLDENSTMIVNFSGPWGKTYKHYSYVDVLQSYLARTSGEEPNLDLAAFKDKVCIIGLTAVGTVDLHPNPFDTLYPAVGMHAETFNSILNKEYIRRASRELNLAILAALSALIALLVLKTKPFKGLIALITMIVMYVAACIAAFDFCRIWIDMLYPIVVMVVLHLSLTLYKYAIEWKKRLLMENELEIAKKIQESFLPKSLPSVAGVEVAAVMFTARQVGGDLYDFITFGEKRLGVMIGDVSGKGVPASLFMAMVIGAFKSFALPGAKPEAVLAGLNTKLCTESSSNLFVTVFYTIFDMERSIMQYTNGGHLPVIHITKDGKLDFLDVDEGAPLGLMDGPYSGKDVKFDKGDDFIYYTDGITEAMDARSEMYGKERLAAVVQKNKHLTSQKLLEVIEKDVRKFEPKSSQHDDMTIIVVRIV